MAGFGGGGSGFSNGQEPEPAAPAEVQRSASDSAVTVDSVSGPLTAAIAGTGRVEVSARMAATASVVLPDHVVTVEEHKGIEDVLGNLWDFIGAGSPGVGPEHVAQLRIVADTLELQYKADEPSRVVIGWCLAWLKGFPGGVLASVTANHLPQIAHLVESYAQVLH